MFRKIQLSIILLLCNYILAQEKITGFVFYDEDASISGANVSIKGTAISTQTDDEGKFSIEAPDEKAVLVISFIGMRSKELIVGKQTHFSITFTDEDVILDQDVIITMTAIFSNTKEKNNVNYLIIEDRAQKVIEKAHVDKKYDSEKYESKKTEYTTVRVFFATDRNFVQNKIPAESFGKKRSNTVNYGTCDVSIPKSHKMGESEKPSVLQFEFNNNPEKHITLLNINSKSKNDFFSELKKDIGDSTQENAFLFVHGYNVSFEDAARRTAQMAYDLDFKGTPVFYSWPSLNKILAYNIDEGNNEWSQRHLKVFLMDFLQKSEAKNIYLIAHSMGNRGLTKAVASIMSENPILTKNIKEIILAAPDIDSDLFKEDIAPILIIGKKPITLYASSNDLALVASQMFSAYPRAGQAGKYMLVLPGIETIDASSVESDLLGHSYFSDTRCVLSDIYCIIHNNFRAAVRPMLRSKALGDLIYWEFRP
nr:alpha/beta hydrolase [uncultured Flavobacterium sp.]